ncbi:nucleoside hydrolase [Natronincola ferrireducens]|uniref:Inosine-uridine nucleoside N-ribohydrolase n=1 Tax=Natronincola ferrireducens TaxID=393762 RepID=A0A1G9EGS5_9FIRM|nr:nucleoside hydrolase [Natronincola ferrireducens]SDK75342.1 Inosine-uridine nucleoside N-ribohydrolase [Natronincola ferrireducens]
MKKVIFDCDNTMGVPNRDVDDGLTLLYLLGRKDINILGVTTTFGNSTIDIVHSNTIEMFQELNLQHIPLHKGAASPRNRQSDASIFLLETVKNNPGEITLLATGSLTNLYGAYQLDNKFFSYVKEIVLMGGITEPLVINGKNLDELNFASDPEASYHVLSSGAKVTVLTGHICLQAFFGRDEYKRLMENPSIKIYQYIKEKTLPWFEFIMEEFGIEGFYNWDVVAAVYINHPEIFVENSLPIISLPQDLKRGFLKVDTLASNSYRVNVPTKIQDINIFNEVVFNSWENADIFLNTDRG